MCFTGSLLYSQSGPGGVGTNDGSSTLKIWYRTDFGLSVTGTSVNSVSNAAGIAALDISETGAQRPTLVTGAVNGYDEISFSGSNRLRTGLNLTTTNFVTNQASSFIVCRADNTTQNSSVYLTDPLASNRFSNHVPWGGTVYYDIGTCCTNDARLQVAALTGLNNYAVWTYDALAATGKQLYRNGTLLQNLANTSNYNSHASHRFNLGGNTTGSAGFQGDVTELIIFINKINTAQRIIVDNYLASKYGITLAANDLYTMDNAGNGNYDHDVAGIGRVDASNINDDAQGTGMVRILNPSGLDNNEFLMWGHDNGIAQATQTTDVPVGVQARFDRVWRVSEVNAAATAVDVGSVEMRWDLSGLGTVVASDLRLLVDTDDDGAFSDEVPIGGASSLGGNIYAFTGVTAITNSRRFTIATISKNSTPLPVELLYFKGESTNNLVQLNWATASEISNNYFSVERSLDALNWKEISIVEGAGISNEKKSYQMVDLEQLKGIVYYRLKQIDFDGVYKYSNKIAINIDGRNQNKIEVYPNPANDILNIVTNQKNYSVEIINMYSQSQLTAKSPTSIDVSHLPSGTYVLRIYFSNGEISNHKLQISR